MGAIGASTGVHRCKKRGNARKQQKMMITSTGFTAEDGSDNVVARTAFELLLPKDVPKQDLTALVITAPTALRPGYYGNSNPPEDAESFGPQLAKSGVGNILSFDVLSKSHLDLEFAETRAWAELLEKAYDVSTTPPSACRMLQNASDDTCDGLDMSLGKKMVTAGAALDMKYAESIRELVSRVNIIAINGGDPAVALLAMRTSPVFTKAVIERIQNGDAVFVGRSAGAMLAGADAGLTNEMPKHVRKSLLDDNTVGLQLIPGSGGGKGAVRPHYSTHWDGPMVDYESALAGRGENVTFYGIPNGEALTCLGKECREVGDHGLPEDQFVKFLSFFERVVTTGHLNLAANIEEIS